MSEQNQQNQQPENTDKGFSADYVKVLRDEAASWRTKFREAEQQLEGLKSSSAASEIASELNSRGVQADPKWVEILKDKSVKESVDHFVTKFPHLVVKKQDEPVSPTPKVNQSRAQSNTNTPSKYTSEVSDIKKDPIARQKLRDQYRNLLLNSK